MSINGPWDEDPMWVPDLQDSEPADNELYEEESLFKDLEPSNEDDHQLLEDELRARQANRQASK